MKPNKQEFFNLFDKLISENIEGCYMGTTMTVDEAKTLLDYSSTIDCKHNPKTNEIVFIFNKN